MDFIEGHAHEESEELQAEPMQPEHWIQLARILAWAVVLSVAADGLSRVFAAWLAH